MSKRNYFSKLLESTDIPAGRYEHTLGHAVPRPGSRRACLCESTDTYSSKCCRGRLRNQGIGVTEAIPGPVYNFKRPDFSSAWA